MEFEKDSTMDVGDLHENEDSSAWMSQLFEKLDLEVDEEDICSTEKTASPKNDANPLNWGMGSLDKESTCPRCNKTLPAPHSVTPFRPLIGARYPVPDVEAKEYYRKKKRDTYRGTDENEMERMSEECLLAFRNYIQIFGREDTEHKFGELWCHCFGVQTHGKICKHFNFTMRTKLRNSDIWTSKLYFAEVKQLFDVMYYFCCPLEASDDGDCYQCKRYQIGDLKHPRRGGYEDGYSISLDSFMVDYSSDSDTDKNELSSSDHWLMFVS